MNDSAPRSLNRQALAFLWRDRAARACACVLLGLALLAVVAPFLPLRPPDEPDGSRSFAPSLQIGDQAGGSAATPVTTYRSTARRLTRKSGLTRKELLLKAGKAGGATVLDTPRNAIAAV